MSEQPRPRAASAAATADDIFLSPRVVDRQAFNEFAAQLRDLIEQAGAQTEALRIAATEAQRTRDGLRDSINANQMKLDMATRALSTIDQKADQIRRVVESASDVASRADDLRAQADQIINERVGILCQRLNEAEDAAVVQIETLHARLTGAATDAAARDAQLRETLDAASGSQAQRLAGLVARADAVVNAENGLASMIERADAAGRTAIRATSELGAVREQADQARKILADSLNAAVPIIDDAGTIQGHLERTVAEALRLTGSAKESMNSLAADHRRAIEADIERVRPAIDRATSEIESVLHAAAAARLAATDATAAAASAAERLATLLSQVQPWKRVLLSDSEAPVGAAITAVVGDLNRELRTVAGALRTHAERTEGALEPDAPAHPALPITVTAAFRSSTSAESAA
jgi:hypothetical protein